MGLAFVLLVLGLTLTGVVVVADLFDALPMTTATALLCVVASLVNLVLIYLVVRDHASH